MKCLVTGGAGFIGSFLCEKLLKNGHEVIAVDNFISGSADNVRHLEWTDNFSIEYGDVILPLRFDVDWIFHLACPASPVFYQKIPIKTVETNVIGTGNVLKLASAIGARVLLTSTSEVYGDPKVHPQTEEYHGNVNPIGPRSCYDEGKRVAETLMYDYQREKNVDIRVVRIFNTYGPRMLRNDGRVVTNFILQALHDENLTVYGDGSQTRSFCYVDDTVQGIITIMEQTMETWPVNIGNPHKEITIRNLAGLIIEMTNSKSKIVEKKLPEDDPKCRRPNIIRANDLGWEPNTSLKNGLKKTIDYWRDYVRK